MAVEVTCGNCRRAFRAKDGARGKSVKCPGCGQTLVIDGRRVPDHDVFISHSTQDKEVADAVCATLEQSRIRCWIAPRDVPGAQTWASAIITAIEEARVMVLIYSSHSNASKQVMREVERGVAKGVAVLPMRTEDVEMSKDLEYFLSAAHWHDALTEPLEEHIRKLIPAIRAILKGDMAVAPGPPDLPAVSGGRKPKLVWWAAGAAMVFLAAVIALVAVALRPGDEPPAVGDRPPAAAEADLADVRAVKNEADAAFQNIKDLDPAQGLRELIEKADSARARADALFARQAFGEARSAYGELFEQCRAIESRQRQREAAGQAIQKARQAAGAMDTFDADIRSLCDVKSAGDLLAGADGCFESGDFDGASTAAAEAQRQWAALAEQAEELRSKRTAAAKARDAARAASKGISKLDEGPAADQLAIAGQRMTEAEEAFAAAEFVQAEQLWSDAVATFARAREFAEAGERLAQAKAQWDRASAKYDLGMFRQHAPEAGGDLARLLQTINDPRITPEAIEAAYGQAEKLLDQGRPEYLAALLERAKAAVAAPGGDAVPKELETILRVERLPEAVELCRQASARAATYRGLLQGHEHIVFGVAFSPDGKTLASASADNTVKLWDMDTATERKSLSAETNWAHAVAYSPDGSLLASGGGDTVIRIRKAQTSLNIANLAGHSTAVNCLIFSPDGKTLASEADGGEMILWDVETRRPRLTLESSLDTFNTFNGAVFLDDGRRIATGCSDKTIAVWDAASGQSQPSLQGHAAEVLCLAAAPDGRTLASGSRDKTVRLWEPDTGQVRAVLAGHAGPVESVAFSPDGRLLASAGEGPSLRVWEAATGKLLALFPVLDSSFGFHCVAFSPDGKLLAAGSDDETIRLWTVHPADNP